MLPILGFFQNLGLPELLIILVIALLIFGHKLPSVARSLGGAVNEFKKGTKEGEDEAMKNQASAAASQLKCGACGALYVPATAGAPCPNCKAPPPAIPK